MEYVELILIPILIGVLEAIKRSGLNPKFIPIISIALGVVMGVIFSGFDVKEGILVGLLMGLSAVGLYSGAKSVVTGLQNK